MKQDTTTTVCDKCGRTLRSRGAYGFAHQCSGHIREINEHFNKIISFASTQKEVREAREARAYANIMYSPGYEDFYRIRKCDII
nr:MAG TPA: zinc-ribbon containing domain protein [Caudoviricetes sp.]